MRVGDRTCRPSRPLEPDTDSPDETAEHLPGNGQVGLEAGGVNAVAVAHAYELVMSALDDPNLSECTHLTSIRQRSTLSE
jgi:hypothetical protein